MDRNYSITITADNLTQKKSPISGQKNESDTEKMSKGILTKEGAKIFMGGYTAYKQVKNFASQIINHEVSLVELRTGSRELQERANFQLQIGNQVLGIAESALVGTMVGGPIGAVVGTVFGVVNTAVSYARKQEEINIKRNIENRSIQMNYIRAGAGGSRRGYE